MCLGSTSTHPNSPNFRKKSTKGALRSITKSLKNPNNCHSNHSDKKLPDTPLKAFFTKKNLFSNNFCSKWCHHASFTLLPSCPFSALTPTLPPSTPGPGPQQQLVMYRDTELLTCPSLCIKLLKWALSCLPSPCVFVCTGKKMLSCLGDTQLYQVRPL